MPHFFDCNLLKTKDIINLAKTKDMKGTNLGEFEELVLLVVASLYDNAYGVAIQEKLLNILDRKATISTIHSTLQRLANKGYLVSEYGGSTQKRGGRRKHLFRVTNNGQAALESAKKYRNILWNTIPSLAFNWGDEK